MLLNNRIDRKEMGTEEPVDIALRCVSPAGDFRCDDKTHCRLSVYDPFSQSSAVHSPGKDSSLQLSSVALKLIPMFIHAPKEVGAPMHIENDSFALFALPSFKISPHLNPLRLQDASIPSPLPPFFASYFVDAMVP